MLRRITRRLQGDEGLTLVEMIVALFIVGFAVIAMSSTLVTSFAALVRNETLVHATSVANEVLEDLQALPWNSLAHSDEDFVVGDEFEGEALVVAADPETPLLPPALIAGDDAIQRGWRDFEVETYITWVEQGEVENAYKRMTVIVSWDDRGSGRSRRVQAFRAATPDEEAMAGLNIFVTSVTTASGELKSENCYPHESSVEQGQPECGKMSSSIRIRAVTTEPVASVTLTYDDRYGVGHDALMTYFPDRGSWETTIPAGSKRFANGETEFFVFAEDPSDPDNEVENSQRLVLLHPLESKNFTADRDFCVDEDGNLREPVRVSVDLIGPDVNMMSTGIPFFWTKPPKLDPEPHEIDGVAGLTEDSDVLNWGGRFLLEFDPEADDSPNLPEGTDDITVTVGPLATVVSGKQFTLPAESLTIERRVVPEEDPC